MQIGLRLHDSAELPFEKRLQNIKAQGFSCAHIALRKTSGLPWEDGALTPGYAMYLKNSFARAELDVAVLGCYLNLGNPNQEELHKTQESYRAHIRFASLLGSGVVGTETGAPNETYTYDKDACHSEEALISFINNLTPVVRYAESMGVIVAIEPVYNHIVWNAKRARTVLDVIGSPNLQIIFDPVNLLSMDNLDNRDEIIDETIDILGKDIAVIHLKDYRSFNGKLELMAAGTGDMDYRSIVRFAREHKPFIHATLEDTKPDNAVAARLAIENLEKTVL